MNLLILLSASTSFVLAVVLLPVLDTRWWTLKSSIVADLVVTNAVIYTSDSSLPYAEAMAVRNGRILRVGNYSSVQDLIGHGTEELNLRGKVVVPGFIDSHLHLIWGGLQMAQVDLHGVNKKDEFIKKIKEAVRDNHQGSWILGGGWNNDLWGGELPVASWIDDVAPNNPVWLSRMDGHMGLVNSVALKIAGITNSTEDPVGGTVLKTPSGEPTGLLVDSAMSIVKSLIPEVSVDERRDALLRASKFALMKGVTTVVDFGRYLPGVSPELVWEDFSDVHRWADSSGKMLIRVCLFFPVETWSRLVDLFHKTGRVISQWIYLGGVKAFADGSLGSNSALLYQPYVDEPFNYGLQATDLDSLFNMTVEADKSGLQVAIHAIGDRANDLILGLYDSVASANGNRDRRFRIEHAQHLAPGAADRFGRQSVIASVQPDHLLYDVDSGEKKLGKIRAQTESYLFRSLLTGNALLAFGSDWPVVSINPLGSIKTAMKRIPLGWKDAWVPSECVTMTDALNAYTISASHAISLDNELGSLSPGKLADFVVLSTVSWDNFAAEASASVEATYVGGVQAYP
ncbi:PREDICTED: uncharacterized protein LOC104606051 isoform X2 [Nelumbo nucifera]|uniref:Uncharacterized protein LOC104606051 isoform X2 n=1 Tax=Nelumbo nucifera TaxID=4432 RepID=A0A1U8AP74_NELNU|nr:PREDICTED: uncharacterized protein LOC104606051 isoform X2 [Nelumbo nucifera]